MSHIKEHNTEHDHALRQWAFEQTISLYGVTNGIAFEDIFSYAQKMFLFVTGEYVPETAEVFSATVVQDVLQP